MSAIRQSGRINRNTTLIDLGMEGVAGVTAVYLIEGQKKCLIDGGTRAEARGLVKALKQLDAFPPDMVVITHAHFDHSQGIPTLRKEAAKEGKRIEVLASHEAVPLLADPAYNEVFGTGPYEKIGDVTPVKEGDTVDLGGLTLRIYEVPGHCRDHIAVLDEVNRCTFVGDTLGYKTGDGASMPPFMPPSWDPDAFRSSIDKLKGVEYDGLCMAHFGYIYGSEAKGILDEAVSTYETWWQLFERNADKLDDVDALLETVIDELDPEFEEFQIVSARLRIMYGLMTGVSRLMGKKPQPVGEFLMRSTLEWLVTGYKTYQQIQ